MNYFMKSYLSCVGSCWYDLQKLNTSSHVQKSRNGSQNLWKKNHVRCDNWSHNIIVVICGRPKIWMKHSTFRMKQCKRSAFGWSTETLDKVFLWLGPVKIMTFLTNKDVVLKSRPLSDIVNPLFRPPYAVSSLTLKFSSAALVLGKFPMFIYIQQRQPQKKSEN